MYLYLTTAPMNKPPSVRPFGRPFAWVSALFAALLSLGTVPVDAGTFVDANLEAAVRAALSKPTGEITPADLATLTSLSAWGKGITNLTGLEWATAMTNLSLGQNLVTNVSPLAGLTNLLELGLGGNWIADLAPIGSLAALNYVDVRWNFLAVSPGTPARAVIDAWLARGVNVDFTPQSTAPKISPIADQTVFVGTPVPVIAFQVADDVTAASNLVVTASSSNQPLLPNAGIVPSDGGTDRTLLLSPVAGQTGTATITLTVSDGVESSSTSFALTVLALPEPVLVYTNGFETPVGPEWSSTNTRVTPTGARRFLGELGNQTVQLALTNLPPHALVQVALDLFILRTWDGNGTINRAGPDVWSLQISNGPVLLSTTFDNHLPGDQAYPGGYPGNYFPSQTGAAEIGTLGYALDYEGEDAVYHIQIPFEHSAANLTLNFAAAGLEALANESWGLDNVQVAVWSEPAGVMQLRAPAVSVAENATNVLIDVERIGGGQGTVTVDYATTNGTALAGSDYTAAHGTLTFGPGETNQTIAIPILNDAVAEVTEYFRVTLSSPTGGAELGRDASFVTVLDDDGYVELTLSSYFLTELAGTVTANLRWTGNTNGLARVRLRSFDETAHAAGVDYWGVDTLVTFNPGETSKSVAVYLNDDILVEPNKTFRLELSEPSSSVNLNANRQARVTIVDDDTPAGPGRGANGQVEALVVQPDGKVLIGGGFWAVNGVSRSGIARLNADGSLDTEFAPSSGANDWVEGITLQPDGKALIGGWFTTIYDTTRNRIARLNPTGSLDTAFAPPGGANNTVYKVLLVPTNKVLIVGAFTSVNGVARNRIARLNDDGTLDTGFNPGTGANNTIWAVASQSDGRLIVSGGFTTFNGAARVRLARLNPDGSLDNTFNVGSGMNSRANVILTLPGDKLLLGGFFATINGVTAHRLARLDATGSLDTTFSVGTGPNSTIWSMALQPDGKILVGGDWTTWSGVNRGHIVRVNANGSLDNTFAIGVGASDYVGGVGALLDGRIALAGNFSLVNGAVRQRFAIVNADGTLPPEPVSWTQWRVADGGNDHWYALTPLAAAWDVAEAEAVARGGHLASLNSASERNFLVTNFLHGVNLLRPFWIGFNDSAQEGTFVWSSGEPVTYTAWNPGEPNNLNNEDYTAFNWFFSGSSNSSLDDLGQWNDTLLAGLYSTGPAEGPYFGIMELPVPPPPDGPVAVYTQDFDGAIGSEWSNTTTSTTPTGGRRVLGEFGNQTVRLTLTNLPPHTLARVGLDLLLINSWDGNNTTYGPDHWSMQVLGGPVLIDTTFSNFSWEDQAYPGAFGSSSRPAATGAAEINTLGYASASGTFLGDTVYRLMVPFANTNDSLVLEFTGRGLQVLSDESWGIENVRVEFFNLPPGGLQTLAFEPVPALYPGDPVPAQARLLASFDEAVNLDVMPVAGVTLISSDTNVFTVNSVGEILAQGAGNAMLTGAYQNLSATTMVSVLAPVALYQQPPSPVYAGGAPAVVALLAGFPGATNVNVAGFVGVTRSSSDPTVASLAPDGLLTPRKPGTVTLTATYAGLTNQVSVTVAFAPGFKPGVLAHRYSFGEPPGTTTLTDSVGGANGEVVNLKPGSTNDNFTGTGQLRLAGSVNATDDPFSAFVNLPNGLVSGRKSVTFEAWVTWNGAAGSSWQRIFDFGRNSAIDAQGAFAEDAFATTGVSYLFLTPRSSDNTFRFAIKQGTGAETPILEAPAPVTVGVETHVAVVYDPVSGAARLYLNGQLVQAAAASLPLTVVQDRNVWLGRSQWSADPFFNGLFNEFRVYDGALLDDQIAASYAAGPENFAGPTEAPANDSLNNAIALSGPSIFTNGSTVSATKEAGEPAHAGNAGGHSAWWTWTAPTNGPVIADTLGSSFDTLLAVYTGDAVSNLTLVASNDNRGDDLQSRLTFTGVAGTTYHLVVDGANGASGGVVLHILQPPPSAPQITTQPESRTMAAGYGVAFEVVATGLPPLTYQWRKDGVDIPDATNSSYSLLAAQAFDAGGYTVAVRNPLDVAISATAALSVIEPYVFMTFAGSAGSAGTANGVGSAARFNGPHGIAIDSAGTIYVSENGTHTIRRITASGVVSTLAGLAGTAGSANGIGSAARFRSPLGVGVDSAGNVYVADAGNYTIRKITTNAVVSTLAGLAGTAGSADGTGNAARFNTPRSVVADPAGNLFVADCYNHTIRKITPSGAVSTFAGQAGSIGAADGSGNAARFNVPGCLALDLASNLYVGDMDNCAIRKITPAGLVSTLAGLAPLNGIADGVAGTARFTAPSGLGIDGVGTLYVADFLSSTIRRVTPNGEVSTVGGLAGVSGRKDGNGILARFGFSRGIASDAAGNVFVADFANHTIRKGVPSAGIQIQQQPVSLTRSESGTADLQVAAVGNGPFAYQWFFNGMPVAGGTQLTLRLDHLGLNQGGVYRVRLRTLDGVEEAWANPVTLEVRTVSWQFVGTPGLPLGVALGDVWSRTPQEAYALGWKTRTRRVDIPDSYLYRWDGVSWTQCCSFPGHYAGRVFGTGTNEVWVTLSRCSLGPPAGCGLDRGGRIYRSTDGGVNWAEQLLPPAAANRELATISGTTDNVQVAVAGGMIVRFDGSNWNVVFADPVELVNAHTVLGPDEGLYVTCWGWGRWDGASWQFNGRQFDFCDATATWAMRDAEGRLAWYAVGNNDLANGVRVWQFDETTQSFGGRTNIVFGEGDGVDLGSATGVWGSAPDDVYVIGELAGVSGGARTGRVYHFDGTAWSPVADFGEIPPPARVCGTAFDDVWIALRDGRLLHRSNTVGTNDPPRITTPPQEQHAVVNTTAQFAVAAQGTPPLFYQWVFNDTVTLAGVTSPVLALPKVRLTNAGTYLVIITNAFGAVTSAPVALDVIVPPSITQQPQGTNVAVGGTVTVDVVAAEATDYQSRKNGANIDGATNATYRIPNAQVPDGGSYTVVVANDAGAVTSGIAEVKVGAEAATAAADLFAQRTVLVLTNGLLPTFTTGFNTNATKELGEPDHAGRLGGHSVWWTWTAPETGIATFDTYGSTFDTVLAVYAGTQLTNLIEVVANDDNDSNEPSQATNRFFASRVQFNAAAGASYQIALDGFGGESGYCVLAGQFEATPDLLPVITAQPQNQVELLGADATFSVAAQGTNLVYQWYLNGAALPGAEVDHLTRTKISAADAGVYSVRITDARTSRYADSHWAVLELSSDPQQGILFQDKLDRLERGTGPSGRPLASRLKNATQSGGDDTGFYSVAAGSVGYHLGNNVQGRTDLREVNHGDLIGAASLYLSFVTTNAGTLVFDTRGSGIDNVFAVYLDGANYDTLASGLLGFATNAANAPVCNTVQVTSGPGGGQFLVAADGIKGERGTLEINWSFGTPPRKLSSLAPVPVQRLDLGSSLTLKLDDPGITNAAPSPLYQWYRDNQFLQETKAPVLLLSNLVSGDSGTYLVVVSNALGVASNALTRVLTKMPLSLSVGSPSYTNGAFRVVLHGTEGESVALEATTDFQQWTVLFDYELTGYESTFADTAAGTYGHRFYRLLPSFRARAVGLRPDGTFQFTIPTGHDQPVVVEMSTNLEQWVPAQTNSPWTGNAVFSVPNAARQPGQSYRLRPGK